MFYVSEQNIQINIDLLSTIHILYRWICAFKCIRLEAGAIDITYKMRYANCKFGN